MKIDWKSCTQQTVYCARKFYESYLDNSGGLAWDGRPCPTWDELNDAVKSHWCAVVHLARKFAAIGELK